VRSSVEEHSGDLDRQSEHTKELIGRHINSHPGLRRQSELLDSIPGIAVTTAATLLAEITDITQYRRARQVAA
jgi:transposase